MNNIKVIIFDLDGVLVSTKDLHYHCFNDALEHYNLIPISYSDHINIYDGLPTKKKLNKLIERGEVPAEYSNRIFELKQKYTESRICNYIKFDKVKFEMFEKLYNDGYKLYIATNSIKSTTYSILEILNIKKFLSGIITNEDIINSKPNPEMYLKCIVDASVCPCETLIVEDSPHGVLAAKNSGSNVMIVKNINEVNYDKIVTHLNDGYKIMNKIKVDNLHVLVPMAGAGSRFPKEKFIFPKPLIPIVNFNGDPMIKVVVDNLNLECKYTFVVNSQHRKEYNLDSVLSMISKNCNIIQVDTVTEGAACTCLLAKKYINNDEELMIVNSDQFVEWNSFDFIYSMRNRNADGGILTFPNQHPKWSYVKYDNDENVLDVKEKEVISDKATVGIYWYKHGKDFVKYSEQMIQKNIRVGSSFNGKGEFYVAPVYNEMIIDNKKIKYYDIQKMWGMGTPADLEYFVENYKI